MSAPQADLSAKDPSALLGDPSAASVPQLGIGTGGKSLGSRLGHLKSVGGDISKRGPRAPLSPQARAAGRERMQVVRSQPASKVVVQQAKPQETRKPGLTAHGAPADRPRQVPKTGETADYRAAFRRILGKDDEPFYHGQSAKVQEKLNEHTRVGFHRLRKRIDEGSIAIAQEDIDLMRGYRKGSGVKKKAQEARQAYDAPPVDRTGNVGPEPRKRSPEREEGHRIALDKVKKAKEALDE